MVVKTTSPDGPFYAAFMPGQEEEMAAHARRQEKERKREEKQDDTEMGT